jgi:hypothetical protein
MVEGWGNRRRQFFVRVEEIMTPRSMLTVVVESNVDNAAELAEAGEFECIPITNSAGIRSFWSRSEGRVKPLTARHRVQHDDNVEWVLPRLAEHQVQFVCYRDEVVGFVDLSDLNRPIARLIILRPLLECEQAISLAVRTKGVSDEDISKVVGSGMVDEARRRKQQARREDLGVPLLEFMGFRHVLRAGSELGLVSISPSEMKRLTEIRNRASHGVLRLVERREDGHELMWALDMSRRIQRALRAALGGGGAGGWRPSG